MGFFMAITKNSASTPAMNNPIRLIRVGDHQKSPSVLPEHEQQITNEIVPQMMSYGAGMSGLGSSDATMMMVSMALPDQPRGSA